MLTISVADQRWEDLYRAAIFEPNSQEVPKRIADAERALVVRARELFGSKEDNIEEEQALDDAMYALKRLAQCLDTSREGSQRDPRVFDFPAGLSRDALSKRI